MDYMQEYEKWLASPALTPEEHAELESIRGDEKEIREYPVEELKFRPRRKKGDKGDKGGAADKELKKLEALEKQERKSKLDDN